MEMLPQGWLVLMTTDSPFWVGAGTVIGSSDKSGAYPASNPQKPENFAATIYQALGIPRDAKCYDSTNRPYHIYHADPIADLMA